ncbi:MAG: GIY-YIG nuclease family protein [Chloroflexi bacterium]|nr:GIY-YIG nuclease family protein [Chloroflexota bacterium]
MMGIYEIVNWQDGKASSYVGSSVDIGKRWSKHVWALRNERHYNSHLQAAWDKYGEGAFSFCVLEQVADTENLLEREQYFLDRAFEVGDTYNVACCAEVSMRGHKHTDEHKRKISAALVGKKHSPVSEETKRKLSEANKGENHPHWGKPCSDKTKRKIGEANAKPYPTFVHRETGEVIPAGRNLAKVCRAKGFNHSHMRAVARGKRDHHKGWVLASSM